MVFGDSNFVVGGTELTYNDQVFGVRIEWGSIRKPQFRGWL
jgi:hypothetical protein